MSRIKTRKCLCCQCFFKPDLRNRKHQHFCGKPDCRAASKKKAQRRWLSLPKNRHYFWGPVHVARVQAWRKKHPGYWKPRIKQNALQDVLITQLSETKEKSAEFAVSPLQDVLASQPLVLIGLIAKFMGSTLQDDIATTARHLKQLGADVLRGEAAHVFVRTSETHTQTIQLA